MVQLTCSLNVFFANTKDDYQFSPDTSLMLSKSIQDVISNSRTNVGKALFIYQASPTGNCEPFMLQAIQKLFGAVKVEPTVPGNEGTMIENAECLVIGGGDFNKLTSAMQKLGPQIWRRVLLGTPTIVFNAGGKFLSSSFITIPEGACTHFNYFPLQFIPSFDPVNGITEVTGMFGQKPGLRYALGLPETDEGGILLEDSKAGLAGAVKTDNMGPGQTFMTAGSRPLYIYERNPAGGVREVTWDISQVDNLPINYM